MNKFDDAISDTKQTWNLLNDLASNGRSKKIWKIIGEEFGAITILAVLKRYK